MSGTETWHSARKPTRPNVAAYLKQEIAELDDDLYLQSGFMVLEEILRLGFLLNHQRFTGRRLQEALELRVQGRCDALTHARENLAPMWALEFRGQLDATLQTLDYFYTLHSGQQPPRQR